MHATKLRHTATFYEPEIDPFFEDLQWERDMELMARKNKIENPKKGWFRFPAKVDDLIRHYQER